MNIKIDSKAFIDWYFKLEDAHWVLEDIKFTLNTRGEYKLQIEQLFSEVIKIPSHLRVDYISSKHRNQEYRPYQCMLI